MFNVYVSNVTKLASFGPSVMHNYREGWLRADGSVSMDSKGCAVFATEAEANAAAVASGYALDSSVRSGLATAFPCPDIGL